MPTKTKTAIISKTEQQRILRDLKVLYKNILDSNKEIDEWDKLLLATVTVLGPACPPHWHMNVLCGRADRLREEVKE